MEEIRAKMLSGLRDAGTLTNEELQNQIKTLESELANMREVMAHGANEAMISFHNFIFKLHNPYIGIDFHLA